MIKTFTNCYKYLAFAVLFLLILGFNHTVSAQTATAPAGTGTALDPYQIATLENLYWIAATDAVVASPDRLTRWSAHYIQTANIDASSTSTWFSGKGWTPIGNGFSGYNFLGTYDGDNHTISGLFIYDDSFSIIYVGLFGYISGSSAIRNLGVINSNFYGNTSGGVVALSDGAGTRIIENVYSTGVVSSDRTAGGIIGSCGNCQISNSYSRAAVTGGDFGYSGGLAGQVFNANSSISNSYSTGVVSGTTGTNGTLKGGLIGRIGSGSPSIANSFYDSETSGQSDDTGKGTPKTTVEMKTQTTFTDAGWDFPSTWTFCASLNNGYPILTSFTGEITSVAPVGSGTVGAPYQIATLANLKWITESSARWASHYIQTADIDASSTAGWNCGLGWLPIGNGTTNFTGTYNGGNYTIRNLTLNRTSDFYTGLFGRLQSATISNLGLVNASFTGGFSSGILSGDANTVTIRNTYSTGSVSGSGFSVGGIVGANINVDIIDSYSNANISGGASNKGGLAGEVNNGSAIINSYATGIVSGTGGGLIGAINSFGSASTVTNSYYDSETSGKSDTGKGVPKTTAEMKTQSTFTGWDFAPLAGDWSINPSGYISYPYLQGFTYDVPEAMPAVNPIPGLAVFVPTDYTWTGSTDSDGGEAGNWDNGLPPAGSDIVIPEGATPYPVFDFDFEAGDITIGNNATFTMAPGFTLTFAAGKGATGDGKIILKSDGTGDASIGDLTGAGSIDVAVQQERFLAGGNRAFRFFSHPYTTAVPLSVVATAIDITGVGGSANGFTTTATNAPSAFRFDPLNADGNEDNDGGWEAFTSISQTIGPHEAIRILFRGSLGQANSLLDDGSYTPDPVTIEWEGTINQGTQNIALVGVASGLEFSDWNLVGNPFPSAIDLSAAGVTHTAGVVDYAVWRPRQTYTGDFSLIAGSGRGGAYLQEPITTASAKIPTGGGFFIRAGGTSATLTIPEPAKTSATPGEITNVLRMDNTASKYGANSLQLIVEADNDFVDRVLVFMDDSYTKAKDLADAPKLANPVVNFYTVSADDWALAIDRRGYQETEGENRIPLHLQAPNYSYTLSLPDFDLEEGRRLRLYDRFTEEYITLAKGTTYDFEVTDDPSTKGHRFDIVMGIEVITSIHPSNHRFQAYLLPNPAQEQVRISIQKPDNVAETTVKIVSMAGVEVRSEQINTATTELDINLSQLSKGIYLVEITHGTERIVKRLIVN